MNGADLSSGWPPLQTVLRWRDPDGQIVEATTETYRESAGFRVYGLRSARGELITAVMDIDPDSGAVSMVAIRGAGQPIRVTPETRRA